MIRHRFHPWPSLRKLFPQTDRSTVLEKTTRRALLTIHQLEDRVVPAAVVENLALSKLFTNLPPTITASIRETLSGSKISSAEYFLDSQPAATVRGTALTAIDGKFDGNTEAVTGTVTPTQFSALLDGVHTISVRGLTKNGSWGPFVSIQFTKDTVNDPPVFGAFNSIPKVLKTRATSLSVFATDPDSTAVSYSLLGAPAWASINSSTGLISLAPGFEVPAGAYPFTVVATDNGLFGDGLNIKSASTTVTANVFAAGVDGNNLFIYGSSAGDAINAVSTSSTSITLGGVVTPIVLGLAADSPQATSFAVPSGGKIVVIAGDGKNLVTVSGTVPSDIAGGSGTDYLRGGSGNDTISGFAGADVIDGGAGNDTIEGGADADWLMGGTGQNVVRGGSGNDRLIQTGDVAFDLVGLAYLSPAANLDSLLAQSVSGDLDYSLSNTLLTYSKSGGGAEAGRDTLPDSDIEYADLVSGDAANVFALAGWSGLGGSLVARGGTDVLSITGSSGKVDVISITDTLLLLGTSQFTISGFESLETNGITGEDTINVSGTLLQSFVNTGNDAIINIALSGANFQSLINTGDSTVITIDVTGADFGSFTTLDNSGDGVTIDVNGADFNTLVNSGTNSTILIDVSGADFSSLVNSGDHAAILIDVSGADFGSFTNLSNSGDSVSIDIRGADFGTLVNQGANADINISGADFGTLLNQGNGTAGDPVTIDITGANFDSLTNAGDHVTIVIDPTGADFQTFNELRNSGDSVSIDISGANFNTLLTQGEGVVIDASAASFSTLLNLTNEQLSQLVGGADFGSLAGVDSLTAVIDVTGANFSSLISSGNDSAIDVTGAEFTSLLNIGDRVEIDATGADFSTLTGATPQVDLSGADFGTLANYGDGVAIDVSGAVFGKLFNFGDGVYIDAGVNTGADFTTLADPDLTLDTTGADFSVLVNDGTGVTIDASGANFGSLINQADGANVQIDVSGADFTTLNNFGDGVVIDATGANFGTLTNQSDGKDVQIDVSGADFGSLVNMGDGVSIDAAGATFQVVSSSGNNITHIKVQGGKEANTIILSGNNLSGITVDGGSGGDVFVITATNSTVFVQGNDGDDRFIVGSPQGLTASINGGAGDDRYIFSGTAKGAISLIEASSIGIDTLDFSGLTSGPVSIDLALTSTQAIAAGLSLTLSNGLGFERVVGTDQADVIRGNGRDNDLAGSDILDDRMGPGPAWNGRVQYVVLDFDTFTNAENPGLAVPSAGANDGGAAEYVYSVNDRQAILNGLSAEYAGFLKSNGGFLEFRTTAAGLTPGQYATIYFNRSRFETLYNPDGTPSGVLQPQPGGQSSQVDFRNMNLGGWATAQVNGLFGGAGQPAATPGNIVTGSVWTAAHELGHLLGLRHSDAFGPMGMGVNNPPGTNSFIPLYPGPVGGYETNSHIMASPAATGFSLEAFVSDTYFGERELVKLAYARVVPATTGVNNLLVAETAASVTGQPITLVPFDVTQGVPQGLNAAKQLAAAATTVLGFISASGQKDLYSFSGRAGDLINLEVFSRGILADRYADTLDTVVRVLKDGVVVAYYDSQATNDDQFEFDSSLVDLVLPSDGTYIIEVSAFNGVGAVSAENATGNYELFVYRFDAANKSDAGDILEGRGGNDRLEGGPGNDTYVFAGTALGTDTLREDVRLEAQGLPSSGRDARDTLDFSGLAGSTTIDLSSTSTQVVSTGNMIVQLSSGLGFEDVRLSATGGSGIGNARANVFYDSPGNDVFNGNDADDVYYLTGGNDRVNGSKGDDVIHFGAGLTGTVSVGGGDGADTLDFSTRTTGITINLNSTNAQAVGGGLTVVLLGVDVENAFGSAVGSNQLTGNPLNNVLLGGAANDTLTGDAGNDVLVGGDGDDNLVGGEGNDLLIGGKGADRIVGSNGGDLLIAGWTAYDAIAYDPRGVNTNLANFSAIQQVWNNGQSLQARRDILRNPVTGLLRTGKVFDDGTPDAVTGSNGNDLLLLNLLEDSNDFKQSEDLKDPLSP